MHHFGNGTSQSVFSATILCVLELSTLKVRTTGSASRRGRIICWTTGYCSRWYRSASSLVFQKLIARTRFGSVSDTKRVSSANPVCLFRIGSTLSLMRVVRSLAFPGLVVTSTVRVNMGRLLLRFCESARGHRSKLTGCSGGSRGGAGLATNCLTTMYSGRNRHRHDGDGLSVL